MVEQSRLSLIERAAARLDLRAITSSTRPSFPVAATPGVQATSAMSGPSPNDTTLGRPDRGTVGEQAARRTAQPMSATFDPKRLKELALVNWAAGRTRAAEEFRIIKRQLLEQAAHPERYGPHSNLVMITSAHAGEGRTFTALNLATSIAMEKSWPVLLVDACDGENAVGTTVVPAPPLGWLDLVDDPAIDPAAAHLQMDIPGLSLMLPGLRQGRNAEVLASANMRRLLADLSSGNRNRIVLIDAPPCLDTSDPATLARVVGQTLLVVEAHTTQQQDVEAAIDLLRPCEHISLILNKNRTG